ncbi:hypothetical protein CIW48_30420 [Methylobacterium sp. P1-11]|uniref:hypothetical protein n=1 Tax=Methylobacterium sp. P1-11 TaxID=2024616 RepID=UPI0011EBD78E|nr:hypothetical protein [Methylobacterium sp. P1-11]KAA0112472.1 hypothetical protein CIW48_30420 [Methylobacterium sp. P1-11]
MEASDLKRLPSRVLIFRDEQQVIAEDVETELAVRARFAPATDLCKTRGDKTHDDAHTDRAELHAGSRVLDRWSSTGT